MKYHKQLAGRLQRCGWVIVDEAHGGDLVDHYFKYDHPSHTNEESSQCIIEITTANNKDGSPGKITGLWQGGRPCRV